jgi:hypothetical protein
VEEANAIVKKRRTDPFINPEQVTEESGSSPPSPELDLGLEGTVEVLELGRPG